MRVWRFILLASVSGGVVAFISSFVSRAAEDATEQKWNAPASEAAKENPIASIQSSIAAGQKIYTKRCAGCHGTPGRGDGPHAVDLGIHPAKLSEVTGSESDGAFWKIATGKKPMPAFGGRRLSETDRWNVINYIRSLSKG